MITQHHTHYKEIDGHDEIILIKQSEHLKKHRKMIQDTKTGRFVACERLTNIPENIQNAAYLRSPLHKEYLKSIKEKKFIQYSTNGLQIRLRLLFNLKTNKLTINTNTVFMRGTKKEEK